ncbi:MAG: hypothetical protein J0G29_03475 [Alphaproteobacteria bacterium]|nr:hypothetical protein [Alphaproteobacteria bacterium]OJV45293.1 MAG: hypothetical protein BGO28_00735 [Alphaproteobacteria bacterium 43-37]
MRTLFQIALTIGITTSALCQAYAQDDMASEIASPQAKHQAYIMVVGPHLGTDNSETVVRQSNELARTLRKNDTGAEIIVHDNFSLPNLQDEVSRLQKLHGENLHLTCIINAHGYDIHGQYRTLTHDGLVTDTDLKSVLAGCDTSLALLTCHSGAFIDDSDKLEVFGGSANTTLLYERHFKNWLTQAVATCSLISAEDFSRTWEAALKKETRFPQEQYPFWRSTMEGSHVFGTKIKTKAG